jgi:prepilin-type N-terminal cleavage/methylation domain-containing protein
MLLGRKEGEIETLAYLRAWRPKKGFTIVEVMVAGLILSIVLGALFISLSTGELSGSISSAKADLQGKIRLIIEWITKDVRQSTIIEINTNTPTVDYLKFKKVTGIDNGTGNYTLSSDYTEYSYNSSSQELIRSQIDGTTQEVLQSIVFNNITQSPFYSDSGVPLVSGGILNSKKLVIVISGEKQLRGSSILNLTLTEEAKIRNE